MRNLKILFVAALAIPLVALASDHYLTTLTSSGSSVSYTVTPGAHLAIQCDAPAYVSVGVGSATASATSGEYVAGNAPPFDVQLAGREDTIAEDSVSGTANCKVFAVAP